MFNLIKINTEIKKLKNCQIDLKKTIKEMEKIKLVERL